MRRLLRFDFDREKFITQITWEGQFPFYFSAVDLRCRRTVSAGMASASSGQQDVGHEGVATRCGDFSLCSFAHLQGLPLMLFPLESPSSTPINHKLIICKNDNYLFLQCSNVSAEKRLIYLHFFYIRDF